jgi:RimJ/RimL family protein N-acetyltransferase
MSDDVMLREVGDADLPVFFENESDPEAVHMAAFTRKDPADRQAFTDHWLKVLGAPSVIARTIVRGGQVVGSVMSYEDSGGPEVTYWLGRSHWGQGIATASLRKFLAEVDTRRPMRARAAKDNAASLRVLQKCGFRVIGRATGFANARGLEIEELILELPGTAIRVGSDLGVPKT